MFEYIFRYFPVHSFFDMYPSEAYDFLSLFDFDEIES